MQPHIGVSSHTPDPANPSPASLERQTSSELEFNPVRATAMEAAVRTFHATRLGIRCKDLLESGWTRGHAWAVGGFQDVSAWLTSPWACSSLQSPSLLQSAFAYMISVKAAKGLLPFALGSSRCSLLLPAMCSYGKDSNST